MGRWSLAQLLLVLPDLLCGTAAQLLTGQFRLFGSGAHPGEGDRFLQMCRRRNGEADLLLPLQGDDRLLPRRLHTPGRLA